MMFRNRLRVRFTFLLAAITGIGILCDVRPVTAEGGISCLDRNGNRINWSLTYKLPKIHESSNPIYKRGAGHVTITPGATEWGESDVGVDDPGSIIGRTLSPLFQNDSSTAYFLYNDQPPNRLPMFDNGHTKGVILTNPQGGIWLMHSVPRFPSLTNHRYTYPITGYTNGQMFLCLTLNTVSKVDGIAEILSYTRPKIFNYSIPKSMIPQLPNLAKLVKIKKALTQTNTRSPPWYKLLQLKVDTLDFLVFAKGPKFHREIYADWIAPELRTPLNVQSWLNGPNPFPSNCTQSNLTVHNVLLKKLNGYDFSSHSDHSKWAVGAEATNPWACIGDLNRMQHQKSRGGAVLCTQNSTLWGLLSKSITDIQPCPRRRRFF